MSVRRVLLSKRGNDGEATDCGGEAYERERKCRPEHRRRAHAYQTTHCFVPNSHRRPIFRGEHAGQRETKRRAEMEVDREHGQAPNTFMSGGDSASGIGNRGWPDIQDRACGS